MYNQKACMDIWLDLPWPLSFPHFTSQSSTNTLAVSIHIYQFMYAWVLGYLARTEWFLLRRRIFLPAALERMRKSSAPFPPFSFIHSYRCTTKIPYSIIWNEIEFKYCQAGGTSFMQYHFILTAIFSICK